MPLNIPNLLTLARIFLIPVFVGIYYLPFHFVDASQQNAIATAIFIVAAVTDWFDGWLARKLNQMSAFGAFLDPVADKLMVGAALFVLVKLGRADASIAMIIVGREIGISALREWMAKLGASGAVAVSSLGKVKTTFQMIAIPVLLFQSTGFMITLGTVLLDLAALLTVVSMVKYFQAAWPEIKAKAHQHDRLPIRKPNVPAGVAKA
jgi:cardiolipin synthase (CMP-forming)